MSYFSAFAQRARAVGIGISLLLVAACSCRLTEPTYRFELAFDATPAAYRNVGAANEPLTVAMRIRNLGGGNLCIAGPIAGPIAGAGMPKGLTVAAKAITPNPYLGQHASVSYGLRAGGILRDIDHVADSSLFDRHNVAVWRLADVAPPLLGLERDRVLTAYRLFGNETMVLLTFQVDWSAVPKTPLVVDSSLPVEITLAYKEPDGQVLRFSQIFRHRLPVHLINAVRGHSNLRPSADGPKTGSFDLMSPKPGTH